MIVYCLQICIITILDQDYNNVRKEKDKLAAHPSGVGNVMGSYWPCFSRKAQRRPGVGNNAGELCLFVPHAAFYAGLWMAIFPYKTEHQRLRRGGAYCGLTVRLLRIKLYGCCCQDLFLAWLL